jgi:Uma2 family endonuclease
MNVLIATPPQTKLITGAELFAMGDIGPCELIDGRIVSMPLTGQKHGMIELNIASELRAFVRRYKLGWVMTGEVGIYTRYNPDRVRGADVLFISTERAPGGPQQGFMTIAPELVVEVLSPTDRWRELQEKIAEYFAVGVEWVWVVVPTSRTVLVYRSSTDAEQLGEGETLQGEGILAGFTLSVAEIFAE